MVANNFPSNIHPHRGMFNLRQAMALRQRGHEVRVVTFVPHFPPLSARWYEYRNLSHAYDVEGISVRVLRGLLGPKSWAIGTLPGQLGRSLRAIEAKFEPDVVHVHGLLPAGAMAAAFRTPYLLTAHGTEAYALPWRRKGLERVARKAISAAARVCAVSAFVGTHLERLGASGVDVIYNGADTETFKPGDRTVAKVELDLPPGRPVIAFGANLIVAKGPYELVAAAARIGDLNPVVVFGGDGAARPGVEAAARDAGIDARFLGRVDHPTLSRLMCACDAYVLASHAEGLPTVLCEAMNAARAIVATRVGGIPEIVKDGETGFTIEKGDVDALADRLRVILEDGTLRERFESAALAFARANLTWDINAARYESIYGEIARNQKSERPRAVKHEAVNA